MDGCLTGHWQPFIQPRMLISFLMQISFGDKEIRARNERGRVERMVHTQNAEEARIGRLPEHECAADP
jgi:hypothetical protein